MGSCGWLCQACRVRNVEDRLRECLSTIKGRRQRETDEDYMVVWEVEEVLSCGWRGCGRTTSRLQGAGYRCKGPIAGAVAEACSEGHMPNSASQSQSKHPLLVTAH